MQFKTCNVQLVVLTIIGQTPFRPVFLVSGLVMIYQFFVTHLNWRMTEGLMQPATQLKRVVLHVKLQKEEHFLNK